MATEHEFEEVFDDCGAEPRQLTGVPTFLDERLHIRSRLVFRAGSHTETITLPTQDSVRLVDPEIADVAGAAR